MNLNHGGLENLVMNVIWNNSSVYNGSMSVSDVTDELNKLNLNKKRAYTTVKTILDRLYTKGLLDKKKVKNKYIYIQIMPRLEMAEKALKKVALEYFSNDFFEMTKFVRELAYEEEKNSINVYR